VECGVCGEAARGEHAVRHGDSRHMHFCSERTSLSYFGERCRRIIAVPLRYQGKILGVYNLFMASDKPVPEDVSLLFHSISEHLGMALENARLTRENLRITLTNERQMLANELHDSLAQTMAYMNMRLSLLRDAMENREQEKSDRYLNDLGRALDSAYAELRELLAQFRNRMDPRGLLPALWDIASSYQDRTGINLDLDNLTPDMNLPPDQEVQVYHIVQEALTNASKHSHAKNVKITVALDNEQYIFTVEDDGIGITHPIKTGDGMHLGLNIMRERAQRLGGNIAVETRAEGGTRVCLTFPAKEKTK
jgi:two-component system nitrate/nitrite sensor histidine kinase NarX